MKSPEIILIEAQLGPVSDLARRAANHELASLAAKREIELLRQLSRERARMAESHEAATASQPEAPESPAMPA